MTSTPQPREPKKFVTFVLEESPDFMYRIDPDFGQSKMRDLVASVKAALKRLETQP